MKQYYSIRTTVDYQSIGNVYPQASMAYTEKELLHSINTDMKLYATYDTMKTLFLKPVASHISWDFNFDPKARVTDVLSASSPAIGGILISERLRDLILQFPLEGVEFIHSRVARNGEPINYYYMYPRPDLVKPNIDLAKTEFVLLDNTDDNFRLEYKVNNMQHFEQRMKNTQFRWLTTKDGLYFKDGSVPASAVIRLSNFETSIFISHELKECIESNAITGIHISQLPFLIKAAD